MRRRLPPRRKRKTRKEAKLKTKIASPISVNKVEVGRIEIEEVGGGERVATVYRDGKKPSVRKTKEAIEEILSRITMWLIQTVAWLVQ